MHGLQNYSKEMVDYISSISVAPIITKSRMEKEKKAVQNELMIHAAHPQMQLYNVMNKMLFRLEGLIRQDDMKLQLKNLEKKNEIVLNNTGDYISLNNSKNCCTII